ncbi:50S ribosomal protein L17 [Patescibacteria group bacterium]|jgi:large subunit ribosomal protein L17|nr:50S ribosomal protein L17 [Patescibacteria group bacterium]
MRHHNANRIFGRDKDERRALMRGLAKSLILHEKITTTEAKAKELRPFAEKLVTAAKLDTLAARRRVLSTLGQPEADVVQKLFSIIAPKYKERQGGYTRVVKMGRTKAGRDEAVIEFV